MTREEIFEVVKGSVSAVIPAYRGPVLETYGMRDLGANSLQAAEITTLAMKKLRVDLPLEQLLSVRSFSGLLDLFEQALGKR